MRTKNKQRGASSVEWIVLVGLIAVGMIAGFTTLKGLMTAALGIEGAQITAAAAGS